MRHPKIYWSVAAILWLALILPSLGTRYSFGWDSSQFSRGVQKFDLANHQPQPPGYPLWIMALRLVTPLTGNPNRAQILLAILFTSAGLYFFHRLAKELLADSAANAATLLLAFSPVVCLNASSAQIYSVDLFISCATGWFAAQLWSGRTELAVPAFIVTALAGGFRQSGATFLLPLLCVSLWVGCRKQPMRMVAALLAGGFCWLAWLVPLAAFSGGFSTLASLNRVEVLVAFEKTSVFFGAPGIRHAKMMAESSLYLTMALSGFLVLLLARRSPSTSPPMPAWATPIFMSLWLGPNLALIYMFHISQPGYILLTVPPAALLISRLAIPALTNLKWVTAGLVLALAASYFPFEQFMGRGSILPFLALRATPRISHLIEVSQREIRTQIDTFPTPRLIYCLRQGFEAPNIRTVTYDFKDVLWADSATISPAASSTPTWFLCGGDACNGVDQSSLRKIAGNQLYSLWTRP